MSRRYRTITAIFAIATLALAAPSFAQDEDTTTFTMSFSTLNPGALGLDTITSVCVSTPGGGASNPDISDPNGNTDWSPDEVNGAGTNTTSTANRPLQGGTHSTLNINVDIPADTSQYVTVRFKGMDNGVASEGDKAYRRCYDAKTGEWGDIECIDETPEKKKKIAEPVPLPL